MNELKTLLRSHHQVVLIGISGVTCSGKSTLVNLFCKFFEGVKTVCQDDFYFPCEEFDINAGAINPNFDTIQSVDMDSLTKQVLALESEIVSHPGLYPKLIIVDGFLLFNHEPLS